MTPEPTRDLDAVLRASSPDPGLHPQAVADLSAALAREVVAADPDPAAAAAPRPRRRRRFLAGLAAAVVLVPTGAYAAERFLAQTGTFGTGHGEEVDTSEWIDLCAPDFAAYVRTVPTPTTALPPGHTWEAVVTDIATQKHAECTSGPGVRMQATGLRSEMLFKAQSLWNCQAIVADDAGDPAGVRAAGRQVAATYDALDALHVFADDNWRPLRDKAAAGDMTSIRQDWAANGQGTCP